MEKGRSFQKYRPVIVGENFIMFFFSLSSIERGLKFHALVVDYLYTALMMLKATSNKPIHLNESLIYLI